MENIVIRKKTKCSISDHIVNEYSLKRNSIFPPNKSPNLFVEKLNLRMKKYYASLYKFENEQCR